MSARAPAANDNRKHRQGACRLNQRDHQRRRRKLGHEPACAHLLHHRADVRSDGSNPQDAEKFMLERDPGRRDGCLVPGAAWLRQVQTCRGFLSDVRVSHRSLRIQQAGALRDLCGGRPRKCCSLEGQRFAEKGVHLRQGRGLATLFRPRAVARGAHNIQGVSDGGFNAGAAPAEAQFRDHQLDDFFVGPQAAIGIDPVDQACYLLRVVIRYAVLLHDDGPRFAPRALRAGDLWIRFRTVSFRVRLRRNRIISL